jgi:hypothetical protein
MIKLKPFAERNESLQHIVIQLVVSTSTSLKQKTFAETKANTEHTTFAFSYFPVKYLYLHDVYM